MGLEEVDPVNEYCLWGDVCARASSWVQMKETPACKLFEKHVTRGQKQDLAERVVNSRKATKVFILTVKEIHVLLAFHSWRIIVLLEFLSQLVA